VTGDSFFDRNDVLEPVGGTGLVYVGRVGASTRVVAYPDREVVTDRRERVVCKALLLHALKLIEEAEARDE
jgi:hypothetical protein